MIQYEPKSNEELRVLLDLADDPRHDVATTTQGPRLAVVIPDNLYERLQEYQKLQESDAPKKSRGAK